MNLLRLHLIMLVILIASFSVVGQNNSGGFLNDLMVNLDLGLGNKHWSYAELTAFQPIVNNENGLLALDMHYMTHLGNENSDSNEKSIGLMISKILLRTLDLVGL